MRLYFDIGNSRCKYVTETGGKLSDIQIFGIENIVEGWLSSTFTDISQCLVADVTNSNVCMIIKTWCEKSSILFELLVSESENHGVSCAYDLPASFGIDRWLALLGSHQLFPEQHCLIIDAGTATTLDYLDDEGRHQGGWILAGIDTLVKSLLANTANVQAKPKAINALSFSSNTSDGVNHAAWAASLGMIEQACLQMINQYSLKSEGLMIIFTGGNAKEFQRHFDRESFVVDELIFIGMQCYNN